MNTSTPLWQSRGFALGAIVIVVVAVVIGILVAASQVGKKSAGSLPLATVGATPSPACSALIAKLPASFDGFAQRSDAPGVVSWKPEDNSSSTDPVQLRCGVARPARLAPTASLQTVFPVQWFSESTTNRGTVWTAVDHRPYVSLFVPLNAGVGPISDISKVLDATLPRAPLDLG